MMRKKNNGKFRHNNNGGRRHGGGGGHHRNNNEQQNLARQKHHATQMREKYQNLARDAQINGDRVDVEYYLQHVDHYMRVLTDIAEIEAERFAAYREQQAANGEPETNEAADAAEGGEQAEAADAAGGEPVQQSSQPRMTRRPQRPQRESRENREPANEGGNAAPTGSKEIPLPASMLTEIQA